MASPTTEVTNDTDEERQPQTSFTVEETRATLQALSSTIHDANSLPSGDSRDVALLTSAAVSRTWDSTVQRIENLLNSLLLTSAPSNQSENTSDDDEDSVRMRVSDAVDDSLERAHTALDAVEGFRDTPLTDAETRADAEAISKPSKAKDAILGITKMLPRDYKPQRNFPDYPIDNSDNPFIPPYSKIPTPVPAPVPDDDCSSSASESSSDSKKKKKRTRRARQGPHPYQKEISESVLANSALVFDEDSVQVYKGLKNTPLTFVDTVDGLVKCADKLRKCTEIAVDLEAHSERSFQGFTCLMQISTRAEDFIIDTLALRGSIHSVLAPIFTDASIQKVMHGADNDIEWLERCFGVYVVNLFDTGQAAKSLFPLCSLSYLLTKYCDVQSPNKRKFQRADWRVRPLPANMLMYARSDTHYLLYIADRLRGELSKTKGKWKEVCEKSGGVCTRRWHKPVYKPYQAMGMAAKHGLGFDVKQVCVLQALCKWRNDTARAEDESIMYVCTNRILFDIAGTKEAGTTPAGVIKALKGKCVPLVRKYKVQIANIIKETRESSVDEKLAQKIKRKLERSVKRQRNAAGVRTVQQKLAEPQSEAESTTTATSDISDIKGSVSTPLPRRTVLRTARRSSASVPKVKVRGKIASALFAEDSDSASEDSEMEEVVAKVLHDAKTGTRKM